MKKICIISNSKLGTFKKFREYFDTKDVKFLIITNKRVRLKKYKNMSIIFIKEKNNLKFNNEVYKIIKIYNPEKIILFYTKKIIKKIYKNYKTINIHTSLLPYYKGIGALKKNYKDKNNFVCSTSHFVNEKFDSGRIIQQVITPNIDQKYRLVEKIAFYQRIVLLNALRNTFENEKFSIINSQSIISPGLDKVNINYKFWK